VLVIGDIDNVSGPASAALAAFAALLRRWADLPARDIVEGPRPAVDCASVHESLGPWSVNHVGRHTQDRIVGQAVDL